MRLSPLDIRKQEFTRGFRGFESEEVNAFLNMVSREWEELLDEQRRTEERIRELESKIAHYERVEEALQEALQTARDSSRIAVENAQQKAKLIIEEAEAIGIEIKKVAEQDRHQMAREAAQLTGRRNEIVARLRAFLLSEMELLARYEGEDPGLFMRLWKSEGQRLEKVPEDIVAEEIQVDDDREETGEAMEEAPPDSETQYKKESEPEQEAVKDHPEPDPPEEPTLFTDEPVPDEDEPPTDEDTAEDDFVLQEEPETQPELTELEVMEEFIDDNPDIPSFSIGSDSPAEVHEDYKEEDTDYEEEDQPDSSDLAPSIEEEQQDDDTDAETSLDTPEEEGQRRVSWTSHSFVTRPLSNVESEEKETENAEKNEPTASDEIDKIRRILDDLE